MATRSRFPTRTVVNSAYLVPWLAAEGPLAYSPAEPPARDYYFQYSWILPGLFEPQVNLRQHRYFGSPRKCSARFLFDFWSKARSDLNAALHQYYALGFVSQNEVRTPLAAYHYVRKPYNTAGFVLIQHGSYQWVSADDQPHIENGEVLLYRGVGAETLFRQLRFRPDELSAANREVCKPALTSVWSGTTRGVRGSP